MQYFLKNLFRTIRNLIEMLIRLIPSQPTRVGTWRIVLAVVALNLTLASLANAQISPDMPNPTGAPNPLTTTLSIFRSNMQDKIMKAADAMPESKYSYRPTKDVRSFGEIVTHVADISYTLCSNVKGEATPATATAKGSKTEIVAYLQARSTTAMACTPGPPKRTSMTRRTFLASMASSRPGAGFDGAVASLPSKSVGRGHNGMCGHDRSCGTAQGAIHCIHRCSQKRWPR